MSSAKHVRFTPIEDEQLKQLVIKYGTNNWNIIASFLPGRNARQVHDRWCNTLSPALNRSEFTPEEDQLLMRLHEELGPKWVKMAKYFNGRSDTSLKSRWNKLQRQLKRNQFLAQFQKSANTPAQQVPIEINFNEEKQEESSLPFEFGFDIGSQTFIEEDPLFCSFNQTLDVIESFE